MNRGWEAKVKRSSCWTFVETVIVSVCVQVSLQVSNTTGSYSRSLSCFSAFGLQRTSAKPDQNIKILRYEDMKYKNQFIRQNKKYLKNQNETVF